MNKRKKVRYWNNMQVEIIRTYSVFRKKKIRIIQTNAIIIVDENAIAMERESGVSIEWLEGRDA